MFNLLEKSSEDILDEALKHEARIRFIGARSLFPKSLMPTIEKLESETKHFTKMNINFLFCYGAQQEIVEGVKQIVRDVKSGKLSEDDICESTIDNYLQTKDIPAPDLILRTGGAKRLSNFLLYQAAHSEFYFLDCMWPELTEVHLEQAISKFNHEKRNFGS